MGFKEYVALAGLLIFVYLVITGEKEGRSSSRVINALSGANTNAILALQGRNPQNYLG